MLLLAGWLQAEYMAALEGVKLQELQMAALQKKIDEGTAKLKHQQSLYDAVRTDRNTYAKDLSEATAEIADMRRTYKQLSRSIEALKTDIEGKDVGLIKEVRAPSARACVRAACMRPQRHLAARTTCALLHPAPAACPAPCSTTSTTAWRRRRRRCATN